MARRVVVGLGNPGSAYDGTRHNVGFAVLDALAALAGRPFVRRGRSLAAQSPSGGDGVPWVLAKPQTFMNLSGRAARELLDEHGPDTALLVVCDDFHLPLGRLRFRVKGSAGGQKGLASILEALPGADVPRLRLGIGDPGRVPAEDFVLRPFGRGEQAAAAEMVARAAACLHDWLADGDFDRLGNAANAPGEPD